MLNNREVVILPRNTLVTTGNYGEKLMNITEELCTFIRSNLVGEDVIVKPETTFEALGLDSFSIIEIILFIERKFGITLPDKELTKENLRDAMSLAKCVAKYQTL